MKLEQFEQRDITRILGIKRPTLQQWIERGFVSPSIEKAGALGRRNVWNRADMFRLGEFHELIKRGFSREEASKFLKNCRVITTSGGKTEIAEWNQEDKDLGPEREDTLGIEYHAVRILVSEETEEETTPTEAPTLEVEPTPEVDYCIECHTDMQALIDTAKPEEEVVSENEGEG